jgi:predicted  nucleic acid-binding Zn-ribbon protein
VDPLTLVNILVEIAELEELQVQARQTIQDNAIKDKNLHELQAEYESDAQQADEEAQAGGRDFRERDRQIREIEARLADRRDHLIGVSDRRQYKALTEEIASLEKKLDQLEEEAIACLDEEDSRLEAAGQARKESSNHGQQTSEALSSLESQTREMTERLENIRLDLARLVSMLPTAEQRQVERLSTKLDQSVVFCQNGACCGCYHQLPVQEAINVDRGRTVVRCPSCMRYIVHRPWK